MLPTLTYLTSELKVLLLKQVGVTGKGNAFNMGDLLLILTEPFDLLIKHDFTLQPQLNS